MVDKRMGFSMWLDFVERDFLNQDFGVLIEKGIINGATSNPSIFAQAISTSEAYKEQLATFKKQSAKQKYEALAIQDIKTAAQKLRANYKNKNDGFISVEVDPFLAHDTAGTIKEGKRLFRDIGEPNVMIKIPATDAGYEAMYTLMSLGISVNATLVFSPAQAAQCLDAMSRGLDELSMGVGLSAQGVISVFVSRFDRLLDPILREKGIQTGKTGIYNAAQIYNLVEEADYPNIRTLFASTGVKGDEYKPDYYIKELLAPHSINTAPLATIEEYIKAPSTQPKLPIVHEEIEKYFESLHSWDIDINAVYAQLMDEGLKAFEQAFSGMLENL